MIKNVKHKLNSCITNKLARENILTDYALQKIHSEGLFKSAMALFVKKWAAYNNFIKYFTDEWINHNPNWYEGAELNVPSSNNALEATNKIFKTNSHSESDFL